MLSLLILIRSFSNLLITRTCIILWMSSNFGQIGPPTTELAALERLRNTPIDLIMGKVVFPLFLLFLIGSFWYFHVTRTSIKAWMSLNFLKWDLTLAHWTQVSDRCPLGYLFLIQSSSKLLVIRTGIKAQSGSILGRIRPVILELIALEWRKFHTFELEYLWSQLANLDQVLCFASLGVGKGCIRFWGRLDQNPGFHGNRKPPLTYNGENDVSTFSRLFLIWSFLYLQVMRGHA